MGDSQSGGSIPCCRCCRGLLCVATFVSGRFAIRWSHYLVAGVAEGCYVLQYSVVRGCSVSVLYLLLSRPFTTACLCVMGCLIFIRHFPWKTLQLVANLRKVMYEFSSGIQWVFATLYSNESNHTNTTHLILQHAGNCQRRDDWHLV